MVTVTVKTLLFLTLVGSLSAAPKPDELLPLNLAPDSIDDDFEGCKIENLKDVLGDLVKVQLQTNKKLEEAWKKLGDADDYVERALKVYSDKQNGIYKALNEQMRTGRKDYDSKFDFMILHYLITCGIQKRHQQQCMITFRRTDINFARNVVGQEMRFGSIASSSFRDDLVQFGKNSCFKIKTCFGADISKLSVHPDEKEVLIPPYEKFKITAVEENKLGCGVVYSLESTGKFSNMKNVLLGLLKNIKG
ncbi:hypothetical protein AOLI_G00102010 [Acnodon oligacanthus]